MIEWNDAPNFGRTDSLKKALELLHTFGKKNVTIVETGTTRGTLGGGVVGDGWATLAFGWYCKKYGGEVYTIDVLKEAISECMEITKPYKDVINYIVSDSVEFLSAFDKHIDLLYLDSSDNPQIIHNELLSVYDRLADDTLILIDDTHDKLRRGKGVIAGKFLLDNSWFLVLDSDGQVLFSKKEYESYTLNPSSTTLPTIKWKSYQSVYEYEQYLAEGEVIHLDIESYDDKAKIWHSIFFSHLPRKEELPKVDGGVRALDIGCHSGYNTKMLENIYGYAEGIDINRGLLEASVLNHDKCKYMSCDSLQYDDESFSLVVAKDVYEHCMNPTLAFNEAYRVLSDGGYILMMIPLDGEAVGIDDIAIHPSFYYNNKSHVWKATLKGVLARIFETGFTEVEYSIHHHSDLFGVTRAYGDRVVTVKAQKIKGIQKVPKKWLFDNLYWCAFLSLNCTGNCSYCIQFLSPDEFVSARTKYSKNKLKPEEWVKFYNNLQKYKNFKLGIIGGEPTMYEGFFDVVNGIKGYYKTVTTNLEFPPAFGDVHNFIENIEDKASLRINTSFHPKLASVDEFCDKIHTLRNAGVVVDQIAMVDYPTSNFKYYYNEFIKRGLVLNPQTFLGKINNVLLPNPESDIARDHKEHGITNFPLYKEGFSYEEKNEILCMTRRFLVAPDGGIYRCHYHLYSRHGAIGNVRDEKLPEPSDYSLCNDFGYCNPCDFPHAKFRPTSINIPAILSQLVPDEDLVKTIVRYFTDNEEALAEVVSLISTELYLSDDVYWELYNNSTIRNALDSFVNEGGAIDNSNALLVAQFDGALFRQLPYGVNIYRLLADSALYKYTDAMGYIIFQIFKNTNDAFKILRTPASALAFGAIIATLQTSIGTIHTGTDTCIIWNLREDNNG
jgi:ubiquinone/menaquinone biosynthesis C-methylase UbiE